MSVGLLKVYPAVLSMSAVGAARTGTPAAFSTAIATPPGAPHTSCCTTGEGLAEALGAGVGDVVPRGAGATECTVLGNAFEMMSPLSTTPTTNNAIRVLFITRANRTASGYFLGLIAPDRLAQTRLPRSWVETNVPRLGLGWPSPSVGHVITSLHVAVSAMPHTSAERLQVNPPPGALHTPIRLLAVPIAVTIPDTRDVTICGDEVSPPKTCETVVYQRGFLPLRATPWKYAMSSFPGSPAMMCTSTFPAPPVGCTVTGADQWLRSEGAHTYFTAAPL